MDRYFRNVIIVALICLTTSTVVNAQHFTEFVFDDTAPANIRQTMQNNAMAVFRQIHESHFNDRQGVTLSASNATPEAIERIQALWSTSRFFCVLPFMTRPVLSTSNGWQVRNIPVFFVEGANLEEQYQYLVLEFTPSGLIADIFIALPMHQYREILQGATDVTDFRRRQLVLGFVEDFRTAFNRRDINFIEQVFSDDALIIVGREVRRSGDSSLLPAGLGNVEVEYFHRTKAEYIAGLRRVFAQNAFINIRFEDIEVIQDEERGHIYGVTLRQHWNTTNYSDEGWLFLMIDFRNEDAPMIWVRTWQPLSVPRNRVFGLVDFDMR